MLTRSKKAIFKRSRFAYEQIITSFAKGDKKALKGLLEKKMYFDFLRLLMKEKKNKLSMKQPLLG